MSLLEYVKEKNRKKINPLQIPSLTFPISINVTDSPVDMPIESIRVGAEWKPPLGENCIIALLKLHDLNYQFVFSQSLKESM